MSSEFQRERRAWVGFNLSSNNWLKLPNFNNKLDRFKKPREIKQDAAEEIHTWAHPSQASPNRRESKTSGSKGSGMTAQKAGEQAEWQRISCRNWSSGLSPTFCKD